MSPTPLRSEPITFRYGLEYGSQEQIFEKLWAQPRVVPCHVEPEAMRFLGRVQVLTNLKPDKELSLYDKMRLYNGEVVLCPRTGRPYNLAEVYARSGDREGIDGLSVRQCARVLEQCATAAVKAARDTRSLLERLQAFAGSSNKGGARTVYNLLRDLNTGNEGSARVPQSEVLVLLRDNFDADGDDIVRLATGLNHEEDPNDVVACVTISHLQEALLAALPNECQDQQDHFREVTRFVQTDMARARVLRIRDMFVRAYIPDFEVQYERVFERYIYSLREWDVDPTDPLTNHARDLEKFLTGDVPSRRLRFLRAIITGDASIQPRYKTVAELADAIERYVVSLLPASGFEKATKRSSVVSELIKQNGHCRLCATNMLEQATTINFN